MNLLGNKAKLLILAVFLFGACEDPGEIGIEGSIPNQLNVNFVELPVGTMVANIDSVGTLNSSSVLFGKYVDENFGTIKANGYTGLSLSLFNFYIDSLAIYDSTFLFLDINYSFGTDFTREMEVKVEPLPDTLSRSKVYYSRDSIISVRTIGTTLFTYDPENPVNLKIPISDVFGEKLFEDARENADNVFGDQDKFRQYLGGLKISTLNETGSILGFDPASADSSKLIIFYHRIDSTGATVSGNYSFLMNFEPSFSEIRSDFTGTQFQNLPGSYKDFTPTTNLAYSNPALGLIMKLDFQSLLNFRDTTSNILINRADILLDVGSTKFTPHPSIRFYVTDSTNRFIISESDQFPRSIQDENSVPLNDPKAGVYTQKFSYDEGKLRYSGEITQYVQNIMNEKLNDQFLLLLSQAPTTDKTGIYHPKASNTNQLVMDKSKIKLRLYYSKLK